MATLSITQGPFTLTECESESPLMFCAARCEQLQCERNLKLQQWQIQDFSSRPHKLYENCSLIWEITYATIPIVYASNKFAPYYCVQIIMRNYPCGQGGLSISVVKSNKKAVRLMAQLIKFYKFYYLLYLNKRWLNSQ